MLFLTHSRNFLKIAICFFFKSDYFISSYLEHMPYIIEGYSWIDAHIYR